MKIKFKEKSKATGTCHWPTTQNIIKIFTWFPVMTLTNHFVWLEYVHQIKSTYKFLHETRKTTTYKEIENVVLDLPIKTVKLNLEVNKNSSKEDLLLKIQYLNQELEEKNTKIKLMKNFMDKKSK